MTVPTGAQSFEFTKVADTSTAVPGGTGNFTSFANMVSVDASGNVGFYGNHATSDKGIYLSRSGVLSAVADLNTAIPGGSGNFTLFSFFGNGIEDGRQAFRGGGSDGQVGIYALVSGSLLKFADTNTPIPEGTGNFTGFGSPYVDGTEYAFLGSGSSNQQGIFVTDGTTFTRIADKTTTVPDIGGNYAWSSQIAFDSGNLAFWSFVSGGTNPGDIIGGYTNEGGLVTLASTATPVPGQAVNFTGFASPPDLSGTTVAFRGGYTGGAGIFTVDLAGGAITTVADFTTAVPGGTGNFTGLQSPTIDGDSIAFKGTFSGKTGIYIQQDSVLKKVISTDDSLDGKPPVFLGIFENSLATGHLAFSVIFSDSSSGIYRTTIGTSAETTFSAWTQAHFTPSEQADPNISGPTAIYGPGDLTNLAKYALGMTPQQATPTDVPTLASTPTERIFTYTRPSDRTDVTYAVEYSSDLGGWTSDDVTHEFVSSSSGVETWRGRHPVSSSGPQFFRLRFNLNSL